MLTEIKEDREHYFEDEKGRLQGEYKYWYENGQLAEHYIFENDIRHGEYKEWHENGQLTAHCFYVNGKKVTFDEMPYPATPEDRLYFILKHELKLLPLEHEC